MKFSSSDDAFAKRLSCLRGALGATEPGGADGSDKDSDIGELSHEGNAYVATTDAFTLPTDAGLGELGVASFVYGGVNAGFEEGVHLSYDDNVPDEDIVVPSDATLYRSGSTATVSDQVPVRAGWTFAGWDTEPDGAGEAYAPGGTIALVADTVLYAQWSKVPVGSLTVYKVLAGNSFLILTGIGFWRDLVEHAIPRATFIDQDDRMVFSQLARTTPHCTFVTDAPYMENEQLPGRTVVTVEDEEAYVTFYLVVRTDASGLATQLFEWASAHGNQ